MKRYTIVAVGLALGLAGLGGCSQKTQDNTQKAADSAGDDAKSLASKAAVAADHAGDKLSKGADAVGDAADKAAKNAEVELDKAGKKIDAKADKVKADLKS